MELEKKYQVAISKNAKGDIEECLDVKIVNADNYKAFKKESAINKKTKEESAEKKIEELKKEISSLDSKLIKLKLIVAKCYFDDEVEMGLVETNETFERAFRHFISFGVAIDLNSEDTPVEYRNIVEVLER